MLRAVVSLCLLVAVAPRAAHADARAKARAHVERATTMHGEGRFAEALRELMTAYALDPQPELLYAIAQTHVRLGDCDQAIAFYQRFLSTRPARVAADAAREAIDVCRTSPPAPSVDAPPPGPAEPPPALEAPPPADVAPPSTLVPAAIEPVAPPPSNLLGWSLVGGGLALGAAGGLTYVLARGQLDDAEAAPTYADYVAGVDGARQKRLIAGVLGGAGVAVTAVGVYWLWGRTRPTDVAVVPSSGGGTVTWTGRF